MSAFTDLALTMDSPSGSLYAYMLDEGSGATSFNNLGAQNLDLTTINGAVTLGDTPGLISGHAAAHQDKDTFMASRVHNGLLDVPTVQSGKVTYFAFFRPSRLKGGNSNPYRVVSKFGRGDINIRRTSVEANIEGQGPLQSRGDLVAADGLYWVVSSFDRPELKWTLHVNGIGAAARTFSTAPPAINWGGGGLLYVGGHATTGASGISGMLAFAGILYNNSLGTTGPGIDLIRNLYTTALAPAGAPSGAALVTPWSQEVVSANSLRSRIMITNDSDTTMYVSLDGNAPVSAGMKLAPYYGTWESTSYTGPISAVLEEPYGAKTLLITEEE